MKTSKKVLVALGVVLIVEKDEVRFSANIVFYVISEDGTPEKHIAHVVCNEDKDRIIEWKDII